MPADDPLFASLPGLAGLAARPASSLPVLPGG